MSNTLRKKPLSKTALSALLLLCCSLLFTACASTTTSDKPVVEAHSVLLLPATSLHKELNGSLTDVASELDRQLDAAGFTVVHAEPDVFEAAKKKALEVSGAVYNPKVGRYVPLNREVYVAQLMSALSVTYKHNVVIKPDLILRTAVVDGDYAKWDNLKREIEIINKPKTPFQMPDRAKGLSLRLKYYTRNGAMLDTSYGGVSLPYVLDFASGKAEYQLKELFFKQKDLQNSVELALAPFLQQVKLP
jgi:hypothetical protein